VPEQTPTVTDRRSEAKRAGPRTAALGLLASAGMEISWQYAIVALVCGLLGLPHFPLGLAAILFASAVAGSLVARGRGWRRYAVAALHAVLLLPAAAAAPMALGAWVRPGHTLADLDFVVAAATTADPAAWATPAVLLGACVSFWWGGLRLARRGLSGDAVGTRFDIGVAVLAFVAGIGWAAGSTGTAVRFLIPSYFLFGVLAVALARSSGTGTRTFPLGFRWAGIASSFVLAAATLALAALMLVPLVRQAALQGYSAVRWAAVSAWPLVLAFLRWLLRFWRPRASESLPPDRREERLPTERSPLDAGPFAEILSWAIAAILAAVVLFLVGIMVWNLVRWLGARTARGGRARSAGGFVRLLRRLAAVLAAIAAFLRGLAPWSRPRPGPGVEAFARLARWGRSSGIVRTPGETPLEYSRRLGGRFSDVRGAIETIVDCLNQELYAGVVLEADRRHDLRRASRALRAPHHWLARTLSRLRPV
jgi:hypothetical protein